VELNPLDGASHALLGRARRAAGRPEEAAAAYRRAAQLEPSLPRAWFAYARAAEAAGADGETVRAAYRRALQLMPRQYHERNRVLGTPAELAAVWNEAAGEPLPGSLLELGVEMGRRWGGLEVGPPESQREKLSHLAEGLRGATPLLERWGSLSPSERNHALWQVAAGRLWEWALRAKLASNG
jgi:tetratricopeptide (TPR) repeat protein